MKCKSLSMDLKRMKEGFWPISTMVAVYVGSSARKVLSSLSELLSRESDVLCKILSSLGVPFLYCH